MASSSSCLQSGLALARVPAAVDDQPCRGTSRPAWRCARRVLKPSVYHSFRYVDCRIATSTPASSNTSLTKSSSEYFWNFSSGQWVSGGPEPHVRVEALDPALRVLLLPLDPVRRGSRPRSGSGRRRRSTCSPLRSYIPPSLRGRPAGPANLLRRESARGVPVARRCSGRGMRRILRRREGPVDQLDPVAVGVLHEADPVLLAAAGRVRRLLGLDVPPSASWPAARRGPRPRAPCGCSPRRGRRAARGRR